MYVFITLKRRGYNDTLRLVESPFLFLFFFKFLFMLKREWERKREGETSVCCSTSLCIRWLILVCARTGDQTSNLGVLR